jgi:hypothetical protein
MICRQSSALENFHALILLITHIDEESELVEGQLLVRREDVVAQLDERMVVAPDDVPYRRTIERLNNRINISSCSMLVTSLFSYEYFGRK